MMIAVCYVILIGLLIDFQIENVSFDIGLVGGIYILLFLLPLLLEEMKDFLLKKSVKLMSILFGLLFAGISAWVFVLVNAEIMKHYQMELMDSTSYFSYAGIMFFRFHIVE